jgi:bla regulator protein BlaR1
VAAGVFHPVIYVPDAWNHWSDRAREIVLDHETAHHRRRDPLWRWVAEIACAVNWCNPLVWWMVRRLTIQCEYACDTSVLRNGVAAGDYAALLCDLAEASSFRGPALAMAERNSLECRVRRLVDARKPQGVAGVGLMIAVAVVSASAFALIGFKSVVAPQISPGEVRTRWSADPFPGGN